MIHTERLILRLWRDSDAEPFAQMNADPEVMRYFPAPLTREESDAMIGRVKAHFAQHRFGPWVVEIPGVAPFAGFVGLAVPSFDVPFAPAVEVAWRLARPFWGHGYATEAAREALRFGFKELGLKEIVAFTVPANSRSIAVMKRLGMSYAGEFDHPKLPPESALQRHVYYISRVQ